MGSAWVQGFIGVISIFGKPVLGHQMRASERIYVGMSSLNGVLMSLEPTPQSKPSATRKEVPGPWHQSASVAGICRNAEISMTPP